MGRPVFSGKSLNACVASASLIIVGAAGADGVVQVHEVLFARGAPAPGLGTSILIERYGAARAREISERGVAPSHVYETFERPLRQPAPGVAHVFLAQGTGQARYELVADGAILPMQELPRVQAALRAAH